ncbi:hypothetical protein EXIGLDRAFT_832280 [Exidia glandulosa HHB12029]|uniref:DUF6535 domain-containing protein n=1 Tax=Exidia glandulosa HHB12029 TaxID=1314781 RepID=A0A165LUS7_EXIGL|nr:hypothetical protein EXIGLDRAFT_832280 [Exidia glandulosa HHB12029]
MDYEQGLSNPSTATAPAKEYGKLPPEELDTEFKKEFPPDPKIGSEMNDGARVWKVYRKEAMAFDNALLDGWSGTLDILLIFAGLFSAVATAFVIESYQFLQPDNAAYTAAALYILVAASNHSTGITLPPPPDLSFASSPTRWINGLWFTSILLSLAVALLSILVKQWITEYRARNNASAKSSRDWARRREVYFKSLNAWPVAELVTLLPVLLHLSLFIFIASVVVFLCALDRGIGIWVIVLGSSLAFFYAGCTLVPLWIPECPTSTPLAHQLRRVMLPPLSLLLLACSAGYAGFLRVRRVFEKHITRIRYQRPRTGARSSNNDFLLPIVSDALPPQVASFPEILEQSRTRIDALYRDPSGISNRLFDERDHLDASALSWLISEVSDSNAVAVGIQALGAVHPTSTLADLLRVQSRVVNFDGETARTRSAVGISAAERLRVRRSTLAVARSGDASSYFNMESLFDIGDPNIPELALWSAATEPLIGNAADPRFRTGCITSTALLELRARAARISELSPVPRIRDTLLSHMLDCLLCCDFDQFSDQDWDLVIDAICPRGFSLYAAMRSTGIHKPLAVADLLSQVTAHAHGLNTEREPLATMLIPCLIIPSPSSSGESLLHLPFLLGALDSPRVLKRFTANQLCQLMEVFRLTVIRVALRQYTVRRTAIVKILPRLWRAVTRAVDFGFPLTDSTAFRREACQVFRIGLLGCLMSPNGDPECLTIILLASAALGPPGQFGR